ncbi:pyridine nucleotide transhydrogenase subunit-alpha [Salmonella enterica subsp. enterica]|uniref:proton-translocating NAD(P)(+) transhydrogenase n=1 Tax=Salmonella enterica I TaxID=59201 RepID=A0A379VRF3_SALET|nr:pyridine nucleotide transhydrogenase subunit-alpha [Salmonella enterica subsp. enterica]
MTTKAFAQAGADIVDGNAIWQSEIILKVNAPEEEEIALLNPGTTLVSFIWPAQNPGLMEKLAERKVTVMAMDSVPRISRAAVARRVKLNGEYRGLSRHCGGRA